MRAGLSAGGQPRAATGDSPWGVLKNAGGIENLRRAQATAESGALLSERAGLGYSFKGYAR